MSVFLIIYGNGLTKDRSRLPVRWARGCHTPQRTPASPPPRPTPTLALAIKTTNLGPAEKVAGCHHPSLSPLKLPRPHPGPGPQWYSFPHCHLPPGSALQADSPPAEATQRTVKHCVVWLRPCLAPQSLHLSRPPEALSGLTAASLSITPGPHYMLHPPRTPQSCPQVPGSFLPPSLCTCCSLFLPEYPFPTSSADRLLFTLQLRCLGLESFLCGGGRRV